MTLQADRINSWAVEPAAMEAMIGVENYLKNTTLEALLLDLVKPPETSSKPWE